MSPLLKYGHQVPGAYVESSWFIRTLIHGACERLPTVCQKAVVDQKLQNTHRLVGLNPQPAYKGNRLIGFLLVGGGLVNYLDNTGAVLFVSFLSIETRKISR